MRIRMDEREIKLDNPDKLVLAGGVVTVKLDAGEVQEIVLAEMGRRGFTVTSPINAVYGSSRDDDCYCQLPTTKVVGMRSSFA